MSKRISQLTQLTAAQVASNDILAIVDVSAGQTKYITVSDLTGLPQFGFQSTGESWAYSSFSSTTRKGVITVPSNATTKYAAGMWVSFSQTTGGTKYGVITAVTSTTLTVNFFSTQTLTNETITAPVYSSQKQPFGAPTLPLKSTDANGWDWYDYGTRRVYKRIRDFNGSLTGGGGDGQLVSLPTDNANTSNLGFLSNVMGGYIGRVFAGVETGNAALPVTSVTLYFWNNTSTITWVGRGFYQAELESL